MILIGVFFLFSDNDALDIFEKIKNLKEKSPFDLGRDIRDPD